MKPKAESLAVQVAPNGHFGFGVFALDAAHAEGALRSR
jgi:hypothetical protein